MHELIYKICVILLIEKKTHIFPSILNIIIARAKSPIFVIFINIL